MPMAYFAIRMDSEDGWEAQRDDLEAQVTNWIGGVPGIMQVQQNSIYTFLTVARFVSQIQLT